MSHKNATYIGTQRIVVGYTPSHDSGESLTYREFSVKYPNITKQLVEEFVQYDPASPEEKENFYNEHRVWVSEQGGLFQIYSRDGDAGIFDLDDAEFLGYLNVLIDPVYQHTRFYYARTDC